MSAATFGNPGINTTSFMRPEDMVSDDVGDNLTADLEPNAIYNTLDDDRDFLYERMPHDLQNHATTLSQTAKKSNQCCPLAAVAVITILVSIVLSAAVSFAVVWWFRASLEPGGAAVGPQSPTKGQTGKQ